jgi:hypothetical protein
MVRRNQGLAITAVAVIGSIVGCGRDAGYGRTDPRAAYWQSKTKAVEARDPTAEAVTNFSKNDFRFMAVYEDGLDVPIVQNRADALTLLDKFGTNPVPETSDALEGESNARYQDAAKQFCVEYNREMLRLLESRTAR